MQFKLNPVFAKHSTKYFKKKKKLINYSKMQNDFKEGGYTVWNR